MLYEAHMSLTGSKTSVDTSTRGPIRDSDPHTLPGAPLPAHAVKARAHCSMLIGSPEVRWLHPSLDHVLELARLRVAESC